MNMQPTEYSIVVTASSHNPTILNPDFLEINKIVLKEWNWKLSAPPITTPAFSTVQYDSRVTITVDTNKLIIVDRSAEINPKASKIKELTNNYVDKLPHVQYNAVGINFSVFIQKDDANDFIHNRFIKPGAWDNEDRKIEEAKITFSYLIANGKLNMSIGPAIVDILSKDNHKRTSKGMLISANFHRETIGFLKPKIVREFVENSEQDWENCKAAVSAIIGK